MQDIHETGSLRQADKNKLWTNKLHCELGGKWSEILATINLLYNSYVKSIHSLSLSLSTNLALMQLDALEKHLVLSSLFSAVLLYI